MCVPHNNLASPRAVPFRREPDTQVCHNAAGARVLLLLLALLLGLAR